MSNNGDTLDTDELSRFREAWRQEVKQRKQVVVAQTAGEPPPLPPTGTADEPDLRDVTAPSLNGFTPLGYAPVQPNTLEWTRNVSSVVHNGRTNFTPNQIAAIDVYGRAIEAEATSDLDGALRLYRQAFRMYDNVDGLWRKAELQAHGERQVPSSLSSGPKRAASMSQPIVLAQGAADIGSLAQKMKATEINDTSRPSETPLHQDLVNRAAHTHSITGELERLVNAFPAHLTFEAEDEKHEVVFNTLPEELLVYILSWLEPTSVEQFAAVCRKARVVTLDPIIWRCVDLYSLYSFSNHYFVDTMFMLSTSPPNYWRVNR
jgi:F-box protein 9